MSFRILILFSVVCLKLSVLEAEQWARFRGMDGAGKGNLPHLKNEITVADYLWAKRLDGNGHSSPVLWQGKIFLTQTNEQANKRTVICYEQANGNVLWKWQDPVVEHHKHRHNNFSSTTPVIDADRIYIVWTSGNETIALALSHKGKLLWRKSWDNFSSDHGHGASPVLVDNVLVFHTDAKDLKKSYLYGIDVENGDVVWEIERDTPKDQKKHLSAYNTPTVIKSGDESLILTLQSNTGWKAVSPLNGEIKWTYPEVYSYRSVASVVVDQGIAFATFGSGGSGKHGEAIKIENNKATKLYSLGMRDGLPYVPTPVVKDGLIFLWSDSGILTCRNLIDGSEVYRERIGGNFYCSPILIGERILNISRSGEMVVVPASRKFEILGRSQFENNGSVHATPAIAKDGLVVRTDTHLIYVKANK